MAQDEKPDSLGNKIDALAAMAGGQDISDDSSSAIEDIPLPEADANAAAALIAQSPSAAAPQAEAPIMTSEAVSGARRARSNSLQQQRSRVHAEQFKRMMVPILLITGILLLVLGGIVAFMLRPVDPGYGDSGMLNNQNFRKIMAMAAFPLGAILMLGAWLFRADIKRSEIAAQRENSKNENTN
ncbi:MAG: hypothetical protein GY794_03330 [bacterium]|nr:hypothetical protein [bacterium]